jgi:hypothetical protein
MATTDIQIVTNILNEDRSFEKIFEGNIFDGDNVSTYLDITFPEIFGPYLKKIEFAMEDGTEKTYELTPDLNQQFLLYNELMIEGVLIYQIIAYKQVGPDSIPVAKWGNIELKISHSLNVSQNTAQAHPDILAQHTIELLDHEQRITDLEAETSSRRTLVIITGDILANTVIDLDVDSGIDYTVTGVEAYLGEDEDEFYDADDKLVKLNGIELEKGDEVIYDTATSFHLDYLLNNGDKIIINS